MTSYSKPKPALLQFKRGDHVYIKGTAVHMLYEINDITHELGRVPLFSVRAVCDPRLIGRGFRQTELVLVARMEVRGQTL